MGFGDGFLRDPNAPAPWSQFHGCAFLHLRAAGAAAKGGRRRRQQQGLHPVRPSACLGPPAFPGADNARCFWEPPHAALIALPNLREDTLVRCLESGERRPQHTTEGCRVEASARRSGMLRISPPALTGLHLFWDHQQKFTVLPSQVMPQKLPELALASDPLGCLEF